MAEITAGIDQDKKLNKQRIAANSRTDRHPVKPPRIPTLCNHTPGIRLCR
jgi:hypothetical protein